MVITDDPLMTLKQISYPKRLDDHGIVIYLLDLCLTAKINNKYWQLLDEKERHKALQFRQHADKVRFVSTRTALKSVLAQRMGVEIADITFNRSEFGKLRLQCQLASADNQVFNISHSGSKALIACADADKGEIGVDIEQIQSFNNQEELQFYIYSKAELATKSGCYLDKTLLCQNWVIKEAVLKAVGCGLTYDMNSFSIIKDTQYDDIFKVINVPDSWLDTCIWFFKCDKDYLAAIAVMSK